LIQLLLRQLGLAKGRQCNSPGELEVYRGISMFILKKQYRYFVKKGMFSDAIHGCGRNLAATCAGCGVSRPMARLA
jgi:hypothetical protein